jgi:SPP1 gp7 family putative phage head morphogenesis protein
MTSIADILDFFEVPTGDAFDVPPAQAIAYFQGKGLKPSFSYADMLKDSHDRAFTVAKMMDVDILATVRDSLDSALANGMTFEQWREGLTPMLQASGWWGRKAKIDPETGRIVKAQLGSAWRLETIFRTNMQAAYAAGQWQEIEAQKAVAPFLMYDAVDDFRTRPEHAGWDNLVLRADHKWWATHYPPNGFHCRCGVVQLDAAQLQALGLRPATKAPDDGDYLWKNPRTGFSVPVPKGIDPGFDHNPGQKIADQAAALLAEKMAAKLTAQQQAAVRKAQKDAKALIQAANTAAAQAQIDAAVAAGKAQLAQRQALAAAKAAEAAAQAQLDTIAAAKTAGSGVAALKAQALKKLSAGADWPELLATQKVQQVEELAAQLKAKADQTKALSTYKAAVLAGKNPPPAAVKAFKALPEAEAEKFLAQLDELKAKAAEEAAAKAAAEAAIKPDLIPAPHTGGQPPDMASLTQVGGQGGSNPGGLFQDTSTGAKWYIKWPKDAEAMRNEVLAAKLYQLGGVDVPELHLVTYQGRPAIASRYVEGLTKGTPAQLAAAAGTADGFAFDAWLANWDAVGLTYDNLLLRAGKAYRIDVGASLRYRAQGTLKPSASFGNTVGELDSMLNAGLNPQAAVVFGQIDKAQLEAGVKRLLALDEAQIRATVEAYGPSDPATRVKLADQLIARRADMAKRFASLAPPSAAAVRAAVQEAAQAVAYARGLLDDAILTAVKGIASRAAKGGQLEAKDVSRVVEAAARFAELAAAAEVMQAGARAELLAYYRPWLADLQAAVQAGEGAPARWTGGTFAGYSGAVEIDATRVKIPPERAPGEVTPPGEANKIIASAFGASAAKLEVPRYAGADQLTTRMHGEHARVISCYTGSYFRELNRALRSGSASGPQKKVEALLNEALTLGPAYKGKVYRGLSLEGAEKAAFVATHKAALASGGTVGHAQFNSTSRQAGSSFGGSIRLVIESRTGVHVAPISLHHGEDEVLFRSDARFRVLEVSEAGGRVTIHLEEV